MDYTDTTVPPKNFLSFQGRKSKKRGMIVIWLLVLLALLGASGTYYFYHKYTLLRQDPAVTSQKELDKTLVAVGALMELPVDEVPTMATILDKNKLAGQAFFAKAENGDILLAYTKSLQAILYRPSTNKIIKVAPIYFNTETLPEESVGQTDTPVEEDAPVEEETVALPLSIAYYNGSTTPNLSANTEQSVTTAFPQYTTAIVKNAFSQNYTENLIVDLTGGHTAEAAAIAATVGGTVSALPDGEVAPDADILIISAQ